MTTVTCPDGAQRHEPFTSHAEAMTWINWGHCCMAERFHTVTDDHDAKEAR